MNLRKFIYQSKERFRNFSFNSGQETKKSRDWSVSIFLIVGCIALIVAAIIVSSVTSNYPSVVTVLVVLVVLSVILMSLVLNPLVHIVMEMKRVSEMDLSLLDRKFSFSPIKEVRKIEKIFIKLVQNLKVYKSFVPSSLFEEDEESDDEEDTTSIANSMSRGGSSIGDGDSSINLTPSSAGKSSTKKTKKSKKSKNGLQRKLKGSTKRQSVIMIVNMDRFDDFIHKLTHQDLIEFHKRFVNAIINIVRDNHGQVETFFGDKIICNWNAIKRNKAENIVEMACRAALECLETIGNLNKDLESQGFPQMTIRIGIDSGTTIVGVFGPSQMKQKTAVGHPVSFAHRLEQLNKKLGTQVLISERIFKHVADFEETFRTRPVDILQMKKKFDEGEQSDIIVYGLSSSKSRLGESWMHESEKKDLVEYDSKYQQAFFAYKSGKLEACIEILNQLQMRKNFTDEVCISLLDRARLFQKIQEKNVIPKDKKQFLRRLVD